MSDKTYAKNFFAFIIGAGVGAVVTSLLVPSSGGETHEAIRDRARRSRESYAETHGTDDPPPPPPRRIHVQTHEPDELPPPKAKSQS